MTDEIKAGEGSISETGKSQEPNVESKQEKTYTKKELDDAVSKTGITWGVKVKELETTISNLNSKIADTESTLSELTSKDPEKADVAKYLKDLKEQRRQLDAEKLTWNEQVKKAQDAEYATTVTLIAAEYEQNDPEKLIKLAKKANAKTNTEIREIASDMGWTPVTKTVPDETKPIPPKVDSGQSGGNGVDTSQMSAKQKIEHGLKKLN